MSVFKIGGNYVIVLLCRTAKKEFNLSKNQRPSFRCKGNRTKISTMFFPFFIRYKFCYL